MLGQATERLQEDPRIYFGVNPLQKARPAIAR